jgi:hypothetical protein
MKKTLFVTLGIVGLIAGSYAFTTIKDPGYKNLKILPKNITEKQMDSVMHHFTASLNVKCNFCHVRTADGKQWDHASDSNKHKLVAREMMKMTNELNDKYFPYSGKAEELSTILTVTCYTCHNGQKEPATRPSRTENAQQNALQDFLKRNLDSTKRNN